MLDRPHAPQSVLETVLYAPNLDAAAAFYRDIVDLKEDSRVPGRHVFLRCEASMVLLFNPEETAERTGGFHAPPHGATGAGHVCFRAESGELDAWAAHLVAAGAEIEADFHWPGGARSIYVRDPAGNSVEFAEAKLWGLGA